MDTYLIHVGFGNVLAANRLVAVISPNSAPTKRMVQDSKSKGFLIDMTSGRRTRAVLIMDSGHIILAAIAPETIAGRVVASHSSPGQKAPQGEEKSG